jgi:hypothetical protein
MKYKVTASFITNCVAEVTANNADEAYQIAKDMDGGEFSQTKQDDWKIQDVKLSDSNFTDEQLAFMEAYQRSVADAPRDVVKQYMLFEDDDKFYKEWGSEYYTGLADARGVWEFAKKFYTKEK